MGNTCQQYIAFLCTEWKDCSKACIWNSGCTKDNLSVFSPGIAEPHPLKFLPCLPATLLHLPRIALLWILPCELCYCLCKPDDKLNQRKSTPGSLHINRAACTKGSAYHGFLEQQHAALTVFAHMLCCLVDSTVQPSPSCHNEKRAPAPPKLKGYIQ